MALRITVPELMKQNLLRLPYRSFPELVKHRPLYLDKVGILLWTEKGNQALGPLATHREVVTNKEGVRKLHLHSLMTEQNQWCHLCYTWRNAVSSRGKSCQDCHTLGRRTKDCLHHQGKMFSLLVFGEQEQTGFQPGNHPPLHGKH